MTWLHYFCLHCGVVVDFMGDDAPIEPICEECGAILSPRLRRSNSRPATASTFPNFCCASSICRNSCRCGGRCDDDNVVSVFT